MKPKVEENVEEVSQEDGKEKEKAQVDSDQEMMNLDNELHSLTHYADDEEELVAQMFATMKGSKLEAMMPPILKEIPLIDVQQLCLHELRGMSQRRILSIINGQEMSGSSSEGSDDEKKPSRLQEENEDSNLGGKFLDEGDESQAGKDMADLENAVADSNLTALDLLELEMRAKLIKTMLEKQDGEGGDTKDVEGLIPDIKIKEEPVTPESTRPEEDVEEPIKSPRNPRSRRRRKYSRRRKHHSGSRSYSSSSCSSSSTGSSFSSRSRSRSGSGSRSYSKSHSSEPMKSGSESSDSRKPTKKKITKKEFEARMKKAKMNRSYRKRKESEDESGDNSKKRKSKSKLQDESSKSSFNIKQALIDNNMAPPEPEEASQRPEEEPEPEKVEEGEVTEKEEGEIDSNEEGACSSRSSRSYSSDTYSSSSRSSYGRSSRRRRRRKGKKSRRHSRRSRSGSSSDVPKIPNWKGAKANLLTKVVSRLDVDNVNSEEDFDSKDGLTKSGTDEGKVESLPVKEDRQSISFSISKKSNTTIKTNSELNDDGVPQRVENEESVVAGDDTFRSDEEAPAVSFTPEKMEEEENEMEIVTLNKSNMKTSSASVIEDKKPKDEEAEPGEVVEDFYKGLEDLTYSEEEGEVEDEAELEKFLHDDTPVEPLNEGDSVIRKSVKVVSSNDEPPIVSWENKKKKKANTFIEGIGHIKKVLTGDPGDQDEEESNDQYREENSAIDEDTQGECVLQDVSEENTQDVIETLPEADPEDSSNSHNLDIIGVIDPTENSQEPFDEELAAGGSSWSMRWLQSEKVQKVVSNSKMLSKVRKKIQAKGKSKPIVKPQKPKPKQEVPVAKEQKPEQPKADQKPQSKPASSNVIGSIEEYEKLFGIRVKAPTSLPTAKPQIKQTATPAVSAATSTGLMFSDDDEDSEEEALWSKIIKK